MNRKLLRWLINALYNAINACIPPSLTFAATLDSALLYSPLLQVDEVSVYIPMKDVNENDINFLKVLRAISTEELRRKQKAIEGGQPNLH